MVAEVNQLMSLAIRKYFKRLTAGLFLLLVFFDVQICRAETIRLISDEETELFLADILRPIYGAIHVPFNRNKVFIVQDNLTYLKSSTDQIQITDKDNFSLWGVVTYTIRSFINR